MKRTMALLAALAVTITSPQAASAAADGKDRKVLVQNLSSQTLQELYASPATAKTWEEDLLGQRTVPAGDSISANIDNGTAECMYDLKAVMANGKTFEHRQ